MTELRRKQLKRVRGIVKRLEKQYAVDPGLYSELPHYSTAKLKGMSRKSIIQSGHATYREKPKPVLKPFPEVSKSDYEEMQANHEVTKILTLLEKGREYQGDYSKKEGGKNAKIAVQSSAQRIEAIIVNSVNKTRVDKDGNEVSGLLYTYQKLKEEYRSFMLLTDLLNKLITAVYDDVYSEWADGRDKYEYELKRLADALGIVDRGF